MPLNISFLVILISATAIFTLISQRHHILIALLSLEAIILSLAFLITLGASSPHSLELFYCLIILTFGACEASIALAILVSISRTYGNDMIRTLAINKC